METGEKPIYRMYNLYALLKFSWPDSCIHVIMRHCLWRGTTTSWRTGLKPGSRKRGWQHINLGLSGNGSVLSTNDEGGQIPAGGMTVGSSISECILRSNTRSIHWWFFLLFFQPYRTSCGKTKLPNYRMRLH